MTPNYMIPGSVSRPTLGTALIQSTRFSGKSGGAYEFKGLVDSFVEIPNDGKLDTKHSMTMLANIYPTGSGGPIINYKTNGWGVHLWQFESNELFVRFVHRSGLFHKPIGSRVLQVSEGIVRF